MILRCKALFTAFAYGTATRHQWFLALLLNTVLIAAAQRAPLLTPVGWVMPERWARSSGVVLAGVDGWPWWRIWCWAAW